MKTLPDNIITSNALGYITHIMRKNVIMHRGKVTTVFCTTKKNVSQNPIAQSLDTCIDMKYIMPIAPLESRSAKFMLPKIPKKTEHLCFIAVGNNDLINYSKLVLANINDTYKLQSINYIVIPTTFGIGSEATNMAILKDNIFFKPYAFMRLSKKNITRIIVHDPLSLYNMSTDDIISRIYTLLAHCIDFTLSSTANESTAASACIRALSAGSAAVLFGCIGASNLQNTILFPMAFNLTTMNSLLAKEIGHSIMHAMTYPLMNRGIGYHEAMHIIASVMCNTPITQQTKKYTDFLIRVRDYAKPRIILDKSVVSTLSPDNMVAEMQQSSMPFMDNCIETIRVPMLEKYCQYICDEIIENHIEKGDEHD